MRRKTDAPSRKNENRIGKEEKSRLCVGTEKAEGKNITGHVGAGSGRFAAGQVREDTSVVFRFLCKFGTEPKHRLLYK